MTHLKAGDKAPKILATDQNGNTVNLAQFAGKKLILFFYPRDNTPTCTAEACNLRDNFKLLKKKGFEIVGVSIDSVKSHKNFETKFSLPFPLLADEKKKIVKDYGVWGTKKLYGKEYEGTFRTTFLINEKGIIEKIFEKVESRNHAEQIINSC
jgi:peroxiredoxin Q/BCP